MVGVRRIFRRKLRANSSQELCLSTISDVSSLNPVVFSVAGGFVEMRELGERRSKQHKNRNGWGVSSGW